MGPTHAAQVDFCSNDYLGFARSEELWQLVDAEIQELRSRSQQGAAKILQLVSSKLELGPGWLGNVKLGSW